MAQSDRKIVPITRSEVWYAYTLLIAETEVGTLRTFNPTQTRTFEYVREIATKGGHIFEGVPGVTDYSVRLEKVRLYNNVLHTAFGISSYDIQNQIQALDIRETIFGPKEYDVQQDMISTTGANLEKNDSTDNLQELGTLTYEKCWITDWGKTVTHTAITVVETMTVRPTRVV